MFRFARAAELNNMEFDRQFDADTVTEQDISRWATRVQNFAKELQLEDTEKAELKNFIDTALAPLDTLIQERETPSVETGLSPDEEEELRRIDEELAR